MIPAVNTENIEGGVSSFSKPGPIETSSPCGGLEERIEVRKFFPILLFHLEFLKTG